MSEIRPEGPGEPLPGPISGWLADYFDADLSDVRLHHQPDALSKTGARAAAFANHIMVRFPVTSAPTAEEMGVLGHEVAHVLQHQRGDLTGAAFTGRGGGVSRLERDAHRHQARIQARYRKAASVDRFQLDWGDLAADPLRCRRLQRGLSAELEARLPELLPGRLFRIDRLEVDVQVDPHDPDHAIVAALAEQICAQALRRAGTSSAPSERMAPAQGPVLYESPQDHAKATRLAKLIQDELDSVLNIAEDWILDLLTGGSYRGERWTPEQIALALRLLQQRDREVEQFNSTYTRYRQGHRVSGRTRGFKTTYLDFLFEQIADEGDEDWAKLMDHLLAVEGAGELFAQPTLLDPGQDPIATAAAAMQASKVEFLAKFEVAARYVLLMLVTRVEQQAIQAIYDYTQVGVQRGQISAEDQRAVVDHFHETLRGQSVGQRLREIETQRKHVKEINDLAGSSDPTIMMASSSQGMIYMTESGRKLMADMRAEWQQAQDEGYRQAEQAKLDQMEQAYQDLVAIHPVLLMQGMDADTVDEFAGSGRTQTQRALKQRLYKVLSDSRESKRMILDDKVNVWLLDRVLPLAMQIVGVTPGTQQAKWIEEKVRAEQIGNLVESILLAVVEIGLGIAAIFAVPFTGGASLAAWAVLAAGIGVGAYSAYRSTQAYQQKDALSNATMNRYEAVLDREGLSAEQKWLWIEWASVLAFGAMDAISMAKALKLTKAVRLVTDGSAPLSKIATDLRIDVRVLEEATHKHIAQVLREGKELQPGLLKLRLERHGFVHLERKGRAWGEARQRLLARRSDEELALLSGILERSAGYQQSSSVIVDFLFRDLDQTLAIAQRHADVDLHTLARLVRDARPAGVTSVRDRLLRVAGAPAEATTRGNARYNLTEAGRALSKHGEDARKAEGKVTAFDIDPPAGQALNDTFRNERGLQIVQEILDDPNVVTRREARKRYLDNYGTEEVLDYVLPDGKGVRFTGDGNKLIGFLEPRWVHARRARFTPSQAADEINAIFIKHIDEEITDEQLLTGVVQALRDAAVPKELTDLLQGVDEYALANVVRHGELPRLIELAQVGNEEMLAYLKHLIEARKSYVLGDDKLFKWAVANAERLQGLPLVQGGKQLNQGTGNYGLIFPARYQGADVVVKADRLVDYDTASETLRVLEGLEPFGGPKPLGKVRVLDPENGLWREGVAMERIDGADLLTLRRLKDAGQPLPFEVTQAHLHAVDALERQLEAAGKHLSESNLGDYILTRDPNRPLVPIDLFVNEGTTQAAARGLVDHNMQPIRQTVESLITKQADAVPPTTPPSGLTGGGSVPTAQATRVPVGATPGTSAASTARELPWDQVWTDRVTGLPSVRTPTALQESRIASRETIGGSANKVYKVTLEDGTTHVVKGESFAGNMTGRLFGISSQSNMEVAAYRMDQLLDMDMVPLTELVEVEGQLMVKQEWRVGQTLRKLKKADSPVLRSKTFESQIADMHTFDYLLQNVDRHGENFLIDPATGRVTLIDNGMAGARWRPFYRTGAQPKAVSRRMVEALRRITPEQMREAMETAPEGFMQATVRRRDELLRLVDEGKIEVLDETVRTTSKFSKWLAPARGTALGSAGPVKAGALNAAGVEQLTFADGATLPVGEFLGEGGNTAVYATRYQSHDAALRLINDMQDPAAIEAASQFVEGVQALKARGVPTVEIYASGVRQSGTRRVYEYAVTERFPPEVLAEGKLGTYFAELKAMTPAQRAQARQSAKYKAFMDFVQQTAGLKKIGDFSPDHIVFHDGTWKVYDTSANHVPWTPSGGEYNPRQTMWARLYDVKAAARGESAADDLIDSETIQDINRVVSESRAGPMEELAAGGDAGAGVAGVSPAVAHATAPVSRPVSSWSTPTHEVQSMGEQAAGKKRGGFFQRSLNKQIDDVDARYREFFGRDVSYTELEALFAGPVGSGLSGKLTSVSFSGPNKLIINATIVDETGRHAGIVQRELLKEQTGAFVLVNKMVKVDPRYGNRGYATELYGRQDAFLSSISQHPDTRVTLHADLAVGRYAWAGQGFKFADDKTRKLFQQQWKEFLDAHGVKLSDAELNRFQEPEHFARFDDGRKFEFPVYLCPGCGEPMIQNAKGQVRCNRWCNSPDSRDIYEQFWDPGSRRLQPNQTLQVHAGKLFLLTHGDWHGVRHVARGTADGGIATAGGAARRIVNPTEELMTPAQGLRTGALDQTLIGVPGPSQGTRVVQTDAGLRTMIHSNPIQGHPAAHRYPIGMEVLVPRSGGRPPEHAVITAHLDNGRVRAQWSENGQLAWKDLRPETLDPINAVGSAARQVKIPTPSEIFPLGSRVRIPRTDGSTDVGQVIEHLPDGRIKVEWRVPEGVATKPLTSEQLNQVNPGMWPQDLIPTGFQKLTGGQRLEQDLLIPSNAQGPAVQIDYHHPEVKRLVAYSKMVARRQASEVQRIEAIQNYTRQRLRGDEAAWRAYEEAHAVQGNKAIGLGDYMQAGLGVCKQNSLALQLGLQELGVESRYVRGFVQMPNGRRGGHAWVEARIDGRWYLVDNLWGDWNLKPVDEVYDPSWVAPRGYRPFRTEGQEAVAYLPAQPRPRPVVEATDPYPIGANVWVPRTGRDPSWAKVTEHRADGKVRVDFEDGYKWVSRESLDPLNPLVVGPVPDDMLPPEIARGLGG